MQDNLTKEEGILIEENINYALGLFDIYNTDYEIIIALKQKGLNEKIITEIVNKIKFDALKKRIEQSKRKIKFGAIFLVILLLLKYLLKTIPDSDNLMNGQKSGEGMLRFVFAFYVEIFNFLLFLSVIITVLGIVTFSKLKKRSRELNQKKSYDLAV